MYSNIFVYLSQVVVVKRLNPQVGWNGWDCGSPGWLDGPVQGNPLIPHVFMEPQLVGSSKCSTGGCVGRGIQKTVNSGGSQTRIGLV